MTEVASLLAPSDHRLTTVRHFEAGPPEGLELTEPGETIATTKEEEWVSKKKKEITNTKQIETRVKRQVVLEDGKVVEDSGPMVTTNTKEDTETQEHSQTELRKLGDDDENKKKDAIQGEAASGEVADRSKWVVVPNPDGVVREVKEKRVVSREETEEVKEVEDVQYLGDITDEQFLAAVQTGKRDLRPLLRSNDGSNVIVSTGPRLVNETSRSNKVTDTEETRELSSVRPDGKIVTETQRTTEHEEVRDDELPEDSPPIDVHLESSQRYLKTREQEDVDYLADGVKIGHEMRYKNETTDAERRGDGLEDSDWDSLSARARRRHQRLRGVEGAPLPTTSPLDRKDALTRRPLNFDREEETRKVETSKWLENHFGSESRSSSNSVVDDEDEPKTKTGFFNVTIKSQPVLREPSPKPFVATVQSAPKHQVEPDRDRAYYQGITDWSERRRQVHSELKSSPLILRDRASPLREQQQRSPIPDYHIRETTPTPTPPQRKRTTERRQRSSQDSRYDSGYRTPSRNEVRDEPVEEPPPDYSPPSPPPLQTEKKQQKTRFAADPPPKQKTGNIIGQSIRKLVGKIRSASAERKARQRAKRSPSPPTYQPGHSIDKDIHHMDARTPKRGTSPIHRYYLGEDPFSGSIYGKENKYDGVKPARSSRRPRDEEPPRSQSTLGRFSKSTGRLPAGRPETRSVQTLPRHASRQENFDHNHKPNSTINVSIINTVSNQSRPIVNGGPAKPARTYKSNLSRSRSFNVNADNYNSAMYKSNPQLHRLEEAPIGLKSPGLISSISRSQRDLTGQLDETQYTTSRFAKNGYSENTNDSKKLFLKGLKERSPELFKTLHETEDDAWRTSSPSYNASAPYKNHSRTYNGDVYEPPTRLVSSPTTHVIRRGSNSSNDFSETYHTTSRNDDPLRPSVTNTVKSFSKKTIPSRDGKSMETIESTETKSVTKSRYVGESSPGARYYEKDRKFNSPGSPVVIEVRNNYRK